MKTLFLLLIAIAVFINSVSAEERRSFQIDDLFDLSLEELLKVTISIEKRNQNLHRSPLSVTVVQEDTLDKFQYYHLTEIAKLVPNTHAGTIFSDVNISNRGIGNSDFKAIDDGVVRLISDGVSLSGSLFPWKNLFDIKHIEFARGPQGTIHGRNAMSGVINLISQEPVRERMYEAKVTGGNFDRKRLELMANQPLADRFWMRLSLLNHQSERLVDEKREHEFLQDLEDQKDEALRFQMLWNKNEKLSFHIKLEYDKKVGYVRPYKLVHFVGLDVNNLPRFFINQRNHELKGYTFKANRLFNSFKLSFITEKHQASELQFLQADASVPNTVSQTTTGKSDQHSHELRLTSNENLDWKWLVGFNYFKQEQYRLSDLIVQSNQIHIFDETNDLEDTSNAIFSQVTVPTGNFEHTIGLRYAKDKASVTGNKQTDLSSVGFGVINDPTSGKNQWKKFVGKLNSS